VTAGYALFFCVLLIGVGAVYRQKLAASLDSQIRDGLEQEWAAAKGYLRIEKGQPTWYYDYRDPDESFIVARIKRVYMLADASGNVMEISEIYNSLGPEPSAKISSAIRSPQPGWEIRDNTQGTAFLIHSGGIYDEDHNKQYFLAVGRSLADNQHILDQFTWTYIGLIPFVMITGCLLGWYLAGRAMTPVLEVAEAARRISGSNLSLRIPSRGAGDELDRLIETFNRMIERLENSFSQIRQFSTDVSHELRTPITAIRGQLEVALFTATNTEQYREAMLNALQDIERLSQIVRALLLLSQAESGQLALQKSWLDLSKLLADVVDQFQIPYEAAHLRLRSDLPPDCRAEVDRIQIERMVSNLLSNALKFTPAGGEVRVALTCHTDRMELSVEDTGCGIATDHLPYIFDRFYRVPGNESSGPERGLGLGLSFVAWIAKAHGGSIQVDSAPGKGTRFRISLPLQVGAPPQPESSEVAVSSGMNEL
jgi:heavy metal sensor kinase